MNETLLVVKNLRTSFFTHVGEVKAVDGIDFEVGKGEAVALVGESGCGKSVTALSIMRLLSHPGKIVGGSVEFEGRSLVDLPDREMHKIRGNEISMVFQDPMTSLNPVLTIRQQLSETLMLHQGMNRRQAGERAVELLRMVGIPSPERRVSQYPHQFSGGMRQRVMIAMALSCNPKLLIADEPTTALDVTIQAQILELMKELKQKLNTSIILITHDLGVVAGLCSRVIVMYAGKIVEQGSLREIFYHPQHPYTWGLLKSVPRLHDTEKRRLMPIVGQPPDLLKPPSGCRFHPRCAYAMGVCLKEQPPHFEVEGEGDHQAACWLLHPQAAPQLSRISPERAVAR
ncbi:MAG: ABC transporter ATP-binding protein [Betaproteobacteria bacterium]